MYMQIFMYNVYRMDNKHNTQHKVVLYDTYILSSTLTFIFQ